VTALPKQGPGEKLPKLDRREAWRAVALRVGATFSEGKRKSQDRVDLEHGPWRVRLDTFTVYTGQVSVTYTRVGAFFTGRADLKLMVRKRNFFDQILKKLGLGGFTPVSRRLASRYVVKGKPERRLRSVVTAGLTEALLAQASLKLEVKAAPRKNRKALGPRTRLVVMHVSGVVTDPDRLVGMFAVVRETLDALEGIGVAAREAVVRV